MIVKLLTEHHLEFLSLKEEAQTRLSLHLSKCQIVGNLMPRLKILRAISPVSIRCRKTVHHFSYIIHVVINKF